VPVVVVFFFFGQGRDEQKGGIKDGREDYKEEGRREPSDVKRGEGG